MENKTRKNRRTLQRKARARKILLTASLLLVVIAASVGGTIAWLTATTDSIVNTFTYGDINITLTEEKPVNKQAKIIPGVDIPKDPKVTVIAGSEACYLFVKVEETGTFVNGKVTYAIVNGENGWTPGDGTKIPANVYYREVGAVTADTDFYVLKDNKVIVSDTLTKEDIKGITTNPTLTFTAYAVQKDGIADAAAAWGKISTTNP